MARTIGTERRQSINSNSIARLEDVDLEGLKRKYMEDVKNGKLPNDERTITEKQADEDSNANAEFLDFFEVEGFGFDPAVDNPQDVMVQISTKMDEAAQELEIKVKDQAERAIEENAAEGIEQVKEFSINDKDPLLKQDFKEKSERIIQKLVLEEKQKTESSSRSSIFDDAREETRRSSTVNDPWAGVSNSGTRTTTATTTTTVNPTDTAQRDKEYARNMADGANAMRNFVYNGPTKAKKKKVSQPHHFGGKKKFSLKGALSTVRNWLSSDEAVLLCKVGVALCLETALAVVTKQRSFDGPGQTLGYIGMMLGVFYIGSELKASGYDQRRLAMI
jgi:hypothetical protein